MLRPLWRMLQITPTAFRTPARAGSRYQLCSSFSSNLGYSIAFRSSSSEAGPAVSLLSALGSATVAAKQLKQPAFQASVAAFRQTPGSDRPISNTVAVAAARSSSSMQPQQQQYSHLLMSPEQQQQLLESVKDRPPVIFYHYPCTDGVFAALVATLHYAARGVTPRYVPHEVYKQVDLQQLQLQPESVAFLLDYSGPDGFPQQLAQHVAQVVVLDHHKTAAEQLSADSNHPANLAVCVDMERSGAAIARDFFKPELTESLQDVFRWVEDADLWRWALVPQSRAFHAGLAVLKTDFHVGRNPGVMQQLQQLDIQDVLVKGEHALRHQEQLVSEAVSASRPYQLGGSAGVTRGWGQAMGCEVSADLILYRSRLGNSLALHSRAQGLEPVGLVAYNESDQPNKETHIKVSLRSIDGFDTSAVSTAFGGGGHAAASSCIIHRHELKAWQDMAK